PDPKAQYNFTDPESRIMQWPDGFVQAYNAHAAVDDLQFIVGHAVTQACNDKQQLVPMIATTTQQSGEATNVLLRHAGDCRAGIDRRTGVWTDQTGAGLPAGSFAGAGEGPR